MEVCKFSSCLFALLLAPCLIACPLSICTYFHTWICLHFHTWICLHFHTFTSHTLPHFRMQACRLSLEAERTKFAKALEEAKKRLAKATKGQHAAEMALAEVSDGGRKGACGRRDDEEAEERPTKAVGSRQGNRWPSLSARG